MLAVLCYHGWEIDPDRAAQDVQELRERRWQDLPLDEVERLLCTRASRSGRFFHVTSDDGAAGDRGLVRALGKLSCPVTLFVSLGEMSSVDRTVHRALSRSAEVRIEDHSLQHRRIFHYRHVVGFFSQIRPWVTGAEKIGLRTGSPVCMYGGELARPGFCPSREAIALCQEEAQSVCEAPGSEAWHACIARRLLSSRAGFLRLGRLCITGEYESRTEYGKRVWASLVDGCRQLEDFTGRKPVAFAYPWWAGSRLADMHLRRLGYRMTFSGRGLCRSCKPFGIPRVFVNNETPRPLNPEFLATVQRSAVLERLRLPLRRVLYA